MTELRVIIFDVDGTLVDSQDDIFESMRRAYGGLGLEVPSRDRVRAIVGLSLDQAMARLSPELKGADHDALVTGYKQSYQALRREKGAAESSPLFPGARDILDALHADPWTLLAVATGKSKRGLDKLMEGHGMAHYFTSAQVADFHPSKPHPSMIETILSETGIARDRAVMVGDTSFDMDMARAAGVMGVGVEWGYHPAHSLNADHLIRDFHALPGLLENILPTG